MSCWKKAIENELSRIRTLNYSKLNCVQQDIADLLQKYELSVLEVILIVNALDRHEMLNRENALEIYKNKYAKIIEIEGVKA